MKEFISTRGLRKPRQVRARRRKTSNGAGAIEGEKGPEPVTRAATEKGGEQLPSSHPWKDDDFTFDVDTYVLPELPETRRKPSDNPKVRAVMAAFAEDRKREMDEFNGLDTA